MNLQLLKNVFLPTFNAKVYPQDSFLKMPVDAQLENLFSPPKMDFT